MTLDITTLQEIKKQVQGKLDSSKSFKGFYSDEERAQIDGKELALEDVIDTINDLISKQS